MLLSDNGICSIQKENIDPKFTIRLPRIKDCKVKSKLLRVFFIAPKNLRGAVLASAKTEKSRAQYSEIYCSSPLQTKATAITPFIAPKNWRGASQIRNRKSRAQYLETYCSLVRYNYRPKQKQ